MKMLMPSTPTVKRTPRLPIQRSLSVNWYPAVPVWKL